MEREFISKRSSGSKVNLEEIQDSRLDTEPNEIGEGVQPISHVVEVLMTEPVREPKPEPVTQFWRSIRARNEFEKYGFLITSENDLVVHGNERTFYQKVIKSSDSEK